MEYAEAIRYLKILKHFTDNDSVGELHKQAYDVAIKAVEKQIPKKPLYIHYEDEGEPPYIKTGCPNGCKIQLNPVTDRHLSYEHVYCPKCGQAIDWNEEEK